jgi:CubicO group peptidase (beta-lactamase class C family)
LALAVSAPVGALGGQAVDRIDVRRMRPTGLLVDAYSYMTPPHNAYYFHHIDELGFRIDQVRRSGPVHPLAMAAAPMPAVHVRANGADIELDEYFARNHVTGFLVIRRDTVLLERYFHGADRRSRFVSQSIAKSILSILVGTAVEQGLIRSVDDPVTAYLPDLAGTGYHEVSIKNVLQMATGVGYSEDYRDSTSGAAAIGAALVTGRPSFADFVRSMKPTDVPPGTAFEYQSVNTQLLGLLLEKVTGMSLSRWAERTLWSRLGAESDAYFYQARGQPDTCAFACFNATLRDYARVGLLMLGKGALGGRRVVSEEWVRQSITPDADFLRPVPAGAPGGPRTGYGYQWWIPPGADGAFMAVGIFGQAIYVNPARGIVVVQTAAWPTPIGVDGLGAERAAMLDALAGRLGVP